MFAREQPAKEFVASFLFMQAYHTSTRAYSSEKSLLLASILYHNS